MLRRTDQIFWIRRYYVQAVLTDKFKSVVRMLKDVKQYLEYMPVTNLLMKL